MKSFPEVQLTSELKNKTHSAIFPKAMMVRSNGKALSSDAQFHLNEKSKQNAARDLPCIHCLPDLQEKWA